MNLPSGGVAGISTHLLDEGVPCPLCLNPTEWQGEHFPSGPPSVAVTRATPSHATGAPGGQLPREQRVSQLVLVAAQHRAGSLKRRLIDWLSNQNGRNKYRGSR